MFVDMILKPVDNFWKKRYREADRKARYMESSWNCERGFHEASEKECLRLSDITVLQAQAIDRLETEVDLKAKRIGELEAKVEALQRELELTNVALRAEQDARRVQVMNSRLWSAQRTAIVDGT